MCRSFEQTQWGEQLVHTVFVQSYLQAMRPTLIISVALLLARRRVLPAAATPPSLTRSRDRRALVRAARRGRISDDTPRPY